MKLPTAANLWRGQACNAFGECTAVQVNPMKIRNWFGFNVPVSNPFVGVACSSLGACGTYDRDEVSAYSNLALQLLSKEHAIEYVAAHLEAGALRAQSRGLTPTGFNSVTWYARSVQTNDEIARLTQLGFPDPSGHARWVLSNMPIALHSLGGLTTSWSFDQAHEPDAFK